MNVAVRSTELTIPVKGARRAFGADPFDLTMPAGLTLAEIIDLIPGIPLSAAPRLRCAVNGVPVPAEWWTRVRPRPDGPLPAVVTVYLVMGGGGGNQTKNILALVATVALTVATGGIAAGGIPAIGLAAGTTAKLVAAGVGIVGSLLINAVFKPPVSAATQGGDQPLGQASLNGNLVARGAPLTRVIGTHKIYPPVVSPALTEIVGDDEVVEAIFGLDGPHLLSDIRVNDAPYADISDIQIETRQGYLNDETITLVTRQGYETAPQLLMSEHVIDPNNTFALLNQSDPASNVPRWERFITRDSPDEVWITLLFPEGLWDSDSTGTTYRLPFRIRFRQLGSTVWINGPEIHYARRRDQAFRTMIKMMWAEAPNPLPTAPTGSGWRWSWRSVPAPAVGTSGIDGYFGDDGWTANAQFASGAGLTDVANCALYSDRVELYIGSSFPQGIYEIEIMRGSALPVGYISNTTYVQVGETDIPTFFGYTINGGEYRTVQDTGARHAKIVVLRNASVWNEEPINSTKKALIAFKGKNKAFNSLSCVASGLIPNWNGSEWDGLEVSSDPAANLRYVLAGDRTVYPLPERQLDNEDFVAFSEYCLANGLRVNLISEGKATDEVARIVAACGVAFLRPSDKYGVVWEHDRSDESPVQVFTPRNSRDFSWTNSLSVRPGGLAVTFLDETNNYIQSEVVVYDDGFSEDTEPVPELDRVTYEGITTIEQAIYRATFDLRQSRLRNVTYSLTTALESINCSRGSLVGVQYDVINRVAGFARVKEIILGSPDNLVTGLVLDSEVSVLDEPLFNEETDLTEVEDVSLLGLTSGASISLKTGSIIVKPLVASDDPDRRNIYFETPFELPAGLEADCLVTIGEVGLEYARMIVMEVKPRRDLTATLALVDEALDIHPLTALEVPGVAAMANLALGLTEWSKLNDAASFDFTVTINYLTLDRTVVSTATGTVVWNNPGDRRDIEVLAKVRVVGTPSGDGLFATVVLRANGNTRYEFGLGVSGGARVLMWQSVFNNVVTVIGVTDFTWVESTDYWLRASAFIDSLMGGAWQDLPGNPLFEASGITKVDAVVAENVHVLTWSTTIQYGAAPAGGATRHLVLVITNEDNDSPGTYSFSSVTVGGNPATIVAQAINSAGPRGCVCVALIAMPAGTSGTLQATVVNSNDTDIDHWAVAVYRVINLRSTTPKSIVTGFISGPNEASISLDVPTNGFGVAGAVAPDENTSNFDGVGAVNAYATDNLAGAAMYSITPGVALQETGDAWVMLGVTFEFSAAPPDAESEAIRIDLADSSVFSSGQVGLGVGGPGTEDTRCTFFSVGYDIGEAPSSPV